MTMPFSSSLLHLLPPPSPPPAPHSATETVQRTLPLFLYNALMVSEDNPTFRLNLFEPRYRILCQRIINEQIPPLMLFVPNFQDYIPKPGDAAFLCHVTSCHPSGHAGTYSIAGRLITTRRIIELSWVEPNTEGLHFALTSPLPPLLGSPYECPAQPLLHILSRNLLEYHPSQIMFVWNKRTRVDLLQPTSPPVASAENSSAPPTSHLMMTCNHRDWTSDGIQAQISVRSNAQLLLHNVRDSTQRWYRGKCRPATSGVRNPNVSQWLHNVAAFHTQNIADAKQSIFALIQQCAAHTPRAPMAPMAPRAPMAPMAPMAATAIAVLPPIPMYLTIAELIHILRQFFPEHASSVISFDWLNRLFQDFNVTPSVVKENARNRHTECYAQLPLSTICVVGHCSTEEGGLIASRTVSDCFKYLDIEWVDAGTDHPNCSPEPYIVHIQQAHIVNFYAFDFNIGVDVSTVQRFLRNVAVRMHWPVVKWLFVGAAQGSGGVAVTGSSSGGGSASPQQTRLNRLPEGVIRLIADYFKFLF